MQSDSLHVCKRPFLTLLVVLSTVILKLSFLPVGQPPVLKLLMCPILRFFAPQGRRDSRINVKFGNAEGTEGSLRPAKFHIARGYLGISGPKNTKICPKNSKVANFFRPAWANPSPDFSKIYVLYARSLSTQCIKIWCNLFYK